MAVDDRSELQVVPVAQIEEDLFRTRWLVRSLWPRSSVGVIGGQPKSAKSFFGLDLATSVASGSPCLGRFEIMKRGRTLVYMAEDSLPDVRQRVAELCRHRQIDIATLELFVITESSLRLDRDADRRALEAAVDSHRPQLLLLDPLIRLHALDENSSREISDLLGYLRDLQRSFDVSIAVVHHTGKQHRQRPGQALRGTGDLHAWLDVGAYLQWQDKCLKLTMEHRTAPACEPILLELVSSEATGTHLEVCATNDDHPFANTIPLRDRILDELRHAGEPMRRQSLRESLRVNNQNLGDALEKLEELGIIRRTPEGWRLG